MKNRRVFLPHPKFSKLQQGNSRNSVCIYGVLAQIRVPYETLSDNIGFCREI